MKERTEFSGKNIEAAINKGLKKLKLTRNKVEVEILNEGKAGLFGMIGAVSAKIKIISTVTETEKVEIKWKKARKKAEDIVLKIIGKIDEKAQIKTEIFNNRINVIIKSEKAAIIIGKDGQTLLAIEYIINLIMKKDSETRVDIKIDIGN